MTRKSSLEEELKKRRFRVTIFGSARTKPNSSDYKLVYTLGKLLGERGIDLVTGGGPGTMEASSKGHKAGRKNKKTKTIGLGIKLPKQQKFNKSIDIRKQFKRFSNRLDNFMLLSNAIVITPGGVGTLLEFFYAWQLMQVNQICHIPIILLGKQWPSLIKWLEKQVLTRKMFDKKDINLLFLANDCNEALKVIDKAYYGHKSGDKNFCLNHKKYRV